MRTMSDTTDTSADAEPFKVEKLSSRFDTDITLPGSKSIALRQLAIAALCDGTTELRGIPACDDSAAMLDCIAALGARNQASRTHHSKRAYRFLGSNNQARCAYEWRIYTPTDRARRLA